MKTLLAALAITMTTGCSTMMSDRIQDVSILSEPSGAHYSIKNQDGQKVRSGVTPDNIKLDAAAGYFDGEKYQVAYDNGPTVELDSEVTGWYWFGLAMSAISGFIVDPLSGDMFSLPDSVNAKL